MQTNNVQIFWGEIAAGEHLLQVYEDESEFIEALSQFVMDGMRSGEGVIVIATRMHLRRLEDHLRARGIDIPAFIRANQYIPRIASEMLSKFMVQHEDGTSWPNEEAFGRFVTDLIKTARGRMGRPVRAFGELVALLWAQGNVGATVRLEHLWEKLCREHAFSLFCAYPKVGLTENTRVAMDAICACHSRMLEHVRQSGVLRDTGVGSDRSVA